LIIPFNVLDFLIFSQTDMTSSTIFAALSFIRCWSSESLACWRSESFPCQGKTHCALNATHRCAVIHKTRGLRENYITT
jgi:hypothetical protein